MTYCEETFLDPSIIRSFPDWRWQCLGYDGIYELTRNNRTVTAAELPDYWIREVLLPFARKDNRHRAEAESESARVLAAYELYAKRIYGGLPAIYEGWAMAGMTNDGTRMVSPLQETYEAIFFDVRHCLDDVEAMVDLVFVPLSRDMWHNYGDIFGKVIAYTLGFDQFLQWVNGKDTPEIIAVRRELNKLKAFRTGLENLRLPVQEAWSKALCRLLRSLRNGDYETDGNGFLEQPDWQGRLERMIDAVLVGKEWQITMIHEAARVIMREGGWDEYAFRSAALRYDFRPGRELRLCGEPALGSEALKLARSPSYCHSLFNSQ